MSAEAYRVKPLKPKDGTWTRVGWCPHGEGWKYQNIMGVIAISSVHMIEGKPQRHISFSHQGQRIPAGWMEAILRQWGAEAWDEDNHVPNGKVRNYWKPVEKTDPQICPCKANEEPHLEEGNYIWRPDSENTQPHI